MWRTDPQDFTGMVANCVFGSVDTVWYLRICTLSPGSSDLGVNVYKWGKDVSWTLASSSLFFFVCLFLF